MDRERGLFHRTRGKLVVHRQEVAFFLECFLLLSHSGWTGGGLEGIRVTESWRYDGNGHRGQRGSMWPIDGASYGVGFQGNCLVDEDDPDDGANALQVRRISPLCDW